MPLWITRFAPLFPGGRGGKQVFCLLFCAFAGLFHPLRAQTPHRVVIASAAHVELSHLGVHTHADYLLFDTGAWDVATMQQDKTRYSHLSALGHSRLSTDHAALPPEYQSLLEGDAPLDNPYGPIDGWKHGRQTGQGGWAAVPFTRNGRRWIKVLVPTRFANWVALQPKAIRRRYLDTRSYSLEIRWINNSDSVPS